MGELVAFCANPGELLDNVPTTTLIFIQVGDYGKIDKTTGCFDREGSVYTAEATAHFAAQYPEKKADGRQTIQTYISDTVKCLELHTGAEL